MAPYSHLSSVGTQYACVSVLSAMQFDGKPQFVRTGSGPPEPEEASPEIKMTGIKRAGRQRMGWTSCAKHVVLDTGVEKKTAFWMVFLSLHSVLCIFDLFNAKTLSIAIELALWGWEKKGLIIPTFCRGQLTII